MQAIDRDWPNASEQDRIDFGDVYLGSISEKTGRAYGAAGVHDAMAVWLDQRMAEWSSQPERRRQPTLPATSEGKINVRELILALGLRRSQEQHFFNHAELGTLVNVAAEMQGMVMNRSAARTSNVNCQWFNTFHGS